MKKKIAMAREVLLVETYRTPKFNLPVEAIDMKHSFRAFSLAFCSAVLLAAAPIAHATPFTIGNAPSGLFAGGPLATVSGTVTSVPSLPGSPTFTASYASAVFVDAFTGNLDFVYGLTVNSATGSPLDFVDHLTMSNFDGFLTGIVADRSSGIAPDSIANEISGIVEVNYTGVEGVHVGQSIETLVFETNAKNFIAGTYTAQDGSVAVFQGFQPAAATPEPSSVVLLGSGLLAAAGVIRRRMTA